MNKKELKKQEQERLQKEFNEIMEVISKKDRKLDSEEYLKERERFVEFNEAWALLHFDFDLYLKLANEKDEEIKRERKCLYRDLILATDGIDIYKDRLDNLDYTNKDNLRRLDEKKYNLACKKKARVLRDLDLLEKDSKEFLKRREELKIKIEEERQKLEAEFHRDYKRYKELYSRETELADKEKEEYRVICARRNDIADEIELLDVDPEGYLKNK